MVLDRVNYKSWEEVCVWLYWHSRIAFPNSFDPHDPLTTKPIRYSVPMLAKSQTPKASSASALSSSIHITAPFPLHHHNITSFNENGSHMGRRNEIREFKPKFEPALLPLARTPCLD